MLTRTSDNAQRAAVNSTAGSDVHVSNTLDTDTRNDASESSSEHTANSKSPKPACSAPNITWNDATKFTTESNATEAETRSHVLEELPDDTMLPDWSAEKSSKNTKLWIDQRTKDTNLFEWSKLLSYPKFYFLCAQLLLKYKTMN